MDEKETRNGIVVISQEQNEVQTFKKWGLDILPHRTKMEKRELDKEFKDAFRPFRVVFVCAMWLTGFDVKCLSCLYLDKPLKAHTLMQTIARANRVSEGKSNGPDRGLYWYRKGAAQGSGRLYGQQEQPGGY